MRIRVVVTFWSTMFCVLPECALAVGGPESRLDISCKGEMGFQFPFCLEVMSYDIQSKIKITIMLYNY